MQKKLFVALSLLSFVGTASGAAAPSEQPFATDKRIYQCFKKIQREIAQKQEEGQKQPSQEEIALCEEILRTAQEAPSPHVWAVGVRKLGGRVISAESEDFWDKNKHLVGE